MSSTTTTKMPTLPARGLGAVMSSCAALTVSALFAGGMLLIMR